jgi:cytochrome c
MPVVAIQSHRLTRSHLPARKEAEMAGQNPQQVGLRPTGQQVDAARQKKIATGTIRRLTEFNQRLKSIIRRGNRLVLRRLKNVGKERVSCQSRCTYC